MEMRAFCAETVHTLPSREIVNTHRGAYKEASVYYSSCISNYTNLLSSEYANDDDIRKAGQKAYYWMGYTAYKQGDTTIANHYFNKAKNILNDNLIQPYE